ncbi:uncharacterized protein B0H64DRAFT_456560 [Chaetomium fimeti]|uniref:Uncharacterized protein n=1 Tax=Chaetomium fimeti TaxID=1854472 RepID=A0AAE0HHX8_9PEZI|nr:hypothetical protein B0H64DRAFT_456560 [Chaetomium fimeti]
MADMADPTAGGDNQTGQRTIREAENRPQSHTSRFASNNQAIDLTGEDRIESPTDAAMPLIRRPAAAASAAGPSQMNNSQQAQTGSAQYEPSLYHPSTIPSITPGSIPGTNTGPLPSIRHSALPTAPIFATGTPITQAPVPQAPITQAPITQAPIPQAPLPVIGPGGRISLRLSPELITSAIGRLVPDSRTLMADIEFRQSQRTCKFMDDCNIIKDMDYDDIKWRKSMSHIFGRNKNCTRSIPDHVWYWFCRKHYQRARYRNSHEYNMLISRIVELQVLRLEAWSNYNRDMAMPQNGVVADWSLMVRRRQQVLMDEEQGRKRKSSAEDQDEPDEDDDEEEVESGGPASPTPADTGAGVVPAWLLALVGTGKTTVEIQAILADIYQDLATHRLSRFPDIELLPNITGDRARPRPNRAKPGSGAAARKNAAAGQGAHQSKRQRGNDDDRRPQPAIQGGRSQFGQPSGPAHPPAHLLGPAPSAAPLAFPPWSSHYPSGQPSHQRSASLDTNQFAQTGYHQPPGPYRFGGYGQGPAHTAGGYNGYFGAQTPEPENGYFSVDYDARRQQQRMQAHSQSAYGQGPGYGQGGGYGQAGGSYPGSGSHQQGMSQVSAAKHSRNLSTPVRPTPMMGMGGMGGGGERSQEFMRGGPADRADNMYAAQAQAQQQYHHVFAPSAPGPSADNVPRYASATTAQLPIHGGRPMSSAPSMPAPGYSAAGLPAPGLSSAGVPPPAPEGYDNRLPPPGPDGYDNPYLPPHSRH